VLHYWTVLYCTVLYCTALYHTLPHCTVPCCDCTVRIVLHCDALYCTVLLLAGDESAPTNVMQFVLPSKYTLETVPQPTDPRVTVKQVRTLCHCNLYCTLTNVLKISIA